MTTHIAPAKTTRCKAALTDGRKLRNARISAAGMVTGYVSAYGRPSVYVCGKLGGRNTSTDLADGKGGFYSELPIDTASVSWKDERGNVICPA